MMKKILLMCFCWFFLALPCVQAEPVALQITDGEVRTLLMSIARMGDISLIVDDSVTGRITMSLDGVEPEQALQMIAAAKGLEVERTGSTFIVRARNPAHREFCQMHILPVHYADLQVVLSAINLSLGEAGIRPAMQNIENGVELKETKAEEAGQLESPAMDGRLMIDQATNAVLLYGSDAEAAAAREIIQRLDVPAKQVSLEAKVVAIQKEATKKLGIEWEWSKLPRYPDQTTTYESVKRSSQNADGSWSTVTEDVPRVKTERAGQKDGTTPGVLRFGKGPEGHPFEFYYEATLNALITDGKATVLTRPNITTIQGREALINIGGEVPVPTLSTTNTTTTTTLSYRQAGIILRYTPRVNADGFITAKVHTEVSSPVYVDELKAYKFQKRSADTMVRLKDGETMVIGGLIGSTESRSLSKVPFLGDLPILGAFFRSVRNSKSESEIMIFLTAHILDKD